ncbi:MAG: hypothetical protein WA667_00070 [Candidatus Nitrosopolaris sp.]
MHKFPVTEKSDNNSFTTYLEGIRSDPLASIIMDRLPKINRHTFPIKLSDEEFSRQVAIQNLFAQVTAATLLQPIKNYYSEKDLKNLRKSLPIKRRAKILGKKLECCKTGPDHWKEYQDVCTEILTYCLVPPLLNPLEQSTTSGHSHRRDLIFPFPKDIKDFWSFVQNKFHMSSGIIIDCKNYSKSLDENQVVITSKYLGVTKFTSFGIIVTRSGLNKNAKKRQVHLWTNEQILLLCLNDADLMKMLNVRENNDDPSKVVDQSLKDFLLSL